MCAIKSLPSETYTNNRLNHSSTRESSRSSLKPAQGYAVQNIENKQVLSYQQLAQKVVPVAAQKKQLAATSAHTLKSGIQGTISPFMASFTQAMPAINTGQSGMVESHVVQNDSGSNLDAQYLAEQHHTKQDISLYFMTNQSLPMESLASQSQPQKLELSDEPYAPVIESLPLSFNLFAGLETPLQLEAPAINTLLSEDVTFMATDGDRALFFANLQEDEVPLINLNGGLFLSQIPPSPMLNSLHDQGVKSASVALQQPIAKGSGLSFDADSELLLTGPLLVTPNVIANRSIPVNRPQVAVAQTTLMQPVKNSEQTLSLKTVSWITPNPMLVAMKGDTTTPSTNAMQNANVVHNTDLAQSTDVTQSADEQINPQGSELGAAAQPKANNREPVSGEQPIITSERFMEDLTKSEKKQPVLQEIATSDDATIMNSTTAKPMVQTVVNSPVAQQSREQSPILQKITELTQQAGKVDGNKGKAGETRTLTYTFSQWQNAPSVTFELATKSELIASTHSQEVQQSLQENRHLFDSEKSVYIRQDHERGQQHNQRQQQQQEEED